MQKLITELKAIDDFSDEEVELFIRALEEKFIPKGEHFLKVDQISQHLGYINKGLTMHYKIVDGTEIPIDFQFESDWVAYLKSFSTGTASDMNIKVLEDTHLLTLSSDAMKRLFSAHPKFMSIRSYYTELTFPH